MGDRAWAQWGWGGSGVYWHPVWMTFGRWTSGGLCSAMIDRYGAAARVPDADPRAVLLEVIEAVVGAGSYNRGVYDEWQVAEMRGERVLDVERQPRRSHVEPTEGGCAHLATGCDGECYIDAFEIGERAGLRPGESYHAAWRSMLAQEGRREGESLTRDAPITRDELVARLGYDPRERTVRRGV